MPHHAEHRCNGGKMIVAQWSASPRSPRKPGSICPHSDSQPARHPPKASAPGSAQSFLRACPASQNAASDGLAVAKWIFPQPPRAALCDDLRLISWKDPQECRPVSASLTKVPRGTRMIRSLPLFAIAAATAAIFPALGGIFALIAEIRQGGEVVVHLKDNIAAPSAVAAVRPAGGHIFFPMERNGSIAAFARFDADFCNGR